MKTVRIRSLRKKSVHRAIFLSYIVLLLITMSSQIIYYARSMGQVSQETEKTQVALLEQLRDSLQDKIDYSNTLRDTLSTVNLLLLARGYGGGYTYTDLFSEIKSSYIPDYFANVAIYFHRSEIVVTPGFKLSAPVYFTSFCQLLDMEYTEFRDLYLDPVLVEEIGPVLTIRMEGEDYKVLPYLNSFRVRPNEDPEVQFVFLIDLASVTQLIGQIRTATQADVYVFDEEGRAILTSEGAPEAEQSLLDAAGDGEQHFQFLKNGEVYFGTQIRGSDLPWRFVVATPWSTYQQQTLSFALQWLLIFLIYLTVGLIVVRYFTRRSYQPVRELQELLEDRMGRKLAAAEGGNEYDRIKLAIAGQFNRDQELMSTLKSQLPILQRDYMLSLVKGLEVEYKDAPTRLRALGITPISEQYLIAMAQFDPHCDFFLEGGEGPDRDCALARLIIQNVGNELLEHDFQCFDLTVDRFQTAFVLNIPPSLSEEDPAAPIRLASERLKELIRFAEANYSLSVQAGVSLCHTGLNNLPRCLDEAKKALERGTVQGTGEPECYGNRRDLSNSYFYSTEMEYQLVSLLRAGHFEEGKELLAHILDMNQEVPPLSEDTIGALLYEISSTLVRTMNNLRVRQGLEPLDIEQARSKLPEHVGLAEARQQYAQFIDEIAELTAQASMGKTEKMVSNMVEFIQANIRESWLDRNSVADEFGVTPQYVSSIFKKYKDENIKEYISRIRLERAKKLLVETSMLTREVAEEIGSNEVGIIRLFKKYEGCTPGEYRQRYSGQGTP